MREFYLPTECEIPRTPPALKPERRRYIPGLVAVQTQIAMEDGLRREYYRNAIRAGSGPIPSTLIALQNECIEQDFWLAMAGRKQGGDLPSALHENCFMRLPGMKTEDARFYAGPLGQPWEPKAI